MNMKRRLFRAGFTIVELFAVIAVLSVLVMITATIYQSAQVQARDAKNADGADKFADAMQLFAAKYQHPPRGGAGSTTAIGAGTECADGINGWVTSAYVCDLENTLVASGYLPSGFTAGLSQNMVYPGTTSGIRALMVYRASFSGSPAVTKSMVMYSMEAPTDADTDHFNAELTKCYGYVPAAGAYSPRDTYGMKNGICVVMQSL